MKQDVRDLEQEITRHKALYYQGRPEISDEDYDRLEAKLKQLDPTNPVLELVGSPLDQSTDKIRHQRRMLSLEKTYEASDIADFLKLGPLVSIFKIDGSSCSLIYEDGRLVAAKTRGDGSVGENILAKAGFIPAIPKRIPRRQRLEVRGEIFCRASAFHAISEDMTSLKLDRPTSQRNIVAGLLGRKEHIQLVQHLSFQAFDWIEDKLPVTTEVAKLEHLAAQGFDVPAFERHTDEASLADRVEETRRFLAEGDYLIDGLVFVLDDLRQHEELGETSHHPRFKLAFKFPGETKSAAILDITWQVSRNGVLTPVAEVEPTELSGAQISRVTLHNMGVVVDFSLKPGDRIEIIRSGEVIPKFLSVLESRPGAPSIPGECPSCATPTVREDIWLLCPNELCPAKQMEVILHWIRQVNVEDLSEKRLQEMIGQGLVSSIPDLYRLSVNDLLTLDKVKEKLATKIYENIQKTKQLDLVTFLSAIGVEGVSRAKAERIVANGHNAIDKVMALDAQTLVAIEGFAEKSAVDIVRSIGTKRKLVTALQDVGIEIAASETYGEGVFSGKKICITGALSAPRAEIEKLIKRHGGAVVGSVSKNTDYLLTNDTNPASSKYKKALELGTTVVSESDFLKMIGA